MSQGSPVLSVLGEFVVDLIPDPTGDGAAFATPVPIPRAASPNEPAMAAPAAMVFKCIM